MFRNIIKFLKNYIILIVKFFWEKCTWFHEKWMAIIFANFLTGCIFVKTIWENLEYFGIGFSGNHVVCLLWLNQGHFYVFGIIILLIIPTSSFFSIHSRITCLCYSVHISKNLKNGVEFWSQKSISLRPI